MLLASAFYLMIQARVIALRSRFVCIAFCLDSMSLVVQYFAVAVVVAQQLVSQGWYDYGYGGLCLCCSLLCRFGCPVGLTFSSISLRRDFFLAAAQ